VLVDAEPTSAPIRTSDPLDAGPYVNRYVVCVENGLGGKVLEHVLEQVVYASDELGDHRVTMRRALDRLLDATEPGGAA